MKLNVVFTESVKWVDAKVEKPDADISVLVCDGFNEPTIAYYDDEFRAWLKNGSLCDLSVTHWAHMPSGPVPGFDI